MAIENRESHLSEGFSQNGSGSGTKFSPTCRKKQMQHKLWLKATGTNEVLKLSSLLKNYLVFG